MKIVSYRTTTPFDNNRGVDGITSLSPTTQKSVMPFNNVPTIQDILDHKTRIEDVYPHAGGDWSPGQDTEKNYKETGDDYKKRERDEEIIRKMFAPRIKSEQRWEVTLPGGKREFLSFELARKYTREKGLPFSLVRRVAQNIIDDEQRKIDVISEALSKTFMVESISAESSTMETGSAFCVLNSYFITCAHVIKSYNKNIVTDKRHFNNTKIGLVQNGKKHDAVLIDVDPKLDIALLKSNIATEPMKISTEATIGEEIITIGSPHGYENNVSTGTIGSTERQVYFYDGAPEYMFVDLSVFPGNSGGPVIKAINGEILGMVTLIVAANGGYGLNAALPSSYIINFCSKHIKLV